MKKNLKIGLTIVGLLIVAYFVGPFIWSAIEFGFRIFIYDLILSYGFYALLILGGGGYLWWKFRKFIHGK